jgi:hypothetical protein
MAMTGLLAHFPFQSHSKILSLLQHFFPLHSFERRRMTHARIFPVVFLLHCFTNSLLAEDYWQQRVHYWIEAALNTTSNSIVGSETLVYVNNSPDTLREVYFRLYWNAYKKGSHGYLKAMREKRYGFNTSGEIELKRFALSRNGMAEPLEYKVDDTILRCSLPQGLAPQDSIGFLIDWVGEIPPPGSRTGVLGSDYNIGQWYPQIAVYDKYGWHTDQYTDEGEFHIDFGTYDVSITLPKSFIIGHTGTLTNPTEVLPDSIVRKLAESRGTEGTLRIADFSDRIVSAEEMLEQATWRIHAANVRDFAWTANEYYVWDVTHWKNTSIHSLHLSSDSVWGEAANFGKELLGFYSENFGEYAFPNLFIVESIIGGGMEYPGLVFIGDPGEPKLQRLFGYIAHEVGHQWYPMMIGSNETEFAFMDEGFTTFITTQAEEHHFGRYNYTHSWTKWYEKFLQFPNSDTRTNDQRDYLKMALTGYEEPVVTHSDKFEEPVLSGTSIYAKTSTVMFMLQYILGDSVFSLVMKEYYNRWKFRHPYPEDFFSLVQQVSRHRDLRWFFDEWLYRTDQCDYALKKISTDKIREGSKEVYRTTVRIRRIGKAIMPLDVELEMEDGSTTTLLIPVDVWRSGEVEYSTVVDLPSKARRGEINPDKRIADVNRLNNRYPWPRVEFRLENTMVDFQDPFAYVVKWRPSLWYNSVDGLKLGAKLSGRYLENLHQFTAWSWLGTRDGRLDFDLSGQSMLPWVTPLSFFSWRGFRIEGRQGVNVKFTKHFRKHYSYPPYQSFSFGFSHFKLKEPAYLVHPTMWEPGLLNRVLFDYGYENRGEFWEVKTKFDFESSLSVRARSQFNYSKRSFDFRFYFTLPENWELATRLYNGRASGTIPIQTEYFLAGGSPIDEFSSPFLRSKGAIPSTVREHALTPGGGNLRGFYNQFLYGDRVDAANVELRFPTLFPFLRTLGDPFLDRAIRWVKLTGFLDVGRIAFQDEDFSKKRLLVDMGFGVRIPIPRVSTLFESVGLTTLRIDFPIYVNSAAGGESRGKFRWVLGLSDSF